MNIEEAKKIIEEWDSWNKENNICTKTILAIRTVLSELEKKDKLIDKLAEHIAISGLERSWTKTFEEDIEDIKKMFTNKVEKEGV
jgi:predicted transcriptional regulator